MSQHSIIKQVFLTNTNSHLIKYEQTRQRELFDQTILTGGKFSLQPNIKLYKFEGIRCQRMRDSQHCKHLCLI